MKLSPVFFITFAIYIAFQIIGELSPILSISELILPIFILTMLKGRELALMLAIDCTTLIYGFVKSYPLFEVFGEYLVTQNGAISNPQQGVLLLYGAALAMYSYPYLLARYVIKKKKIRERVAKMLP